MLGQVRRDSFVLEVHILCAEPSPPWRIFSNGSALLPVWNGRAWCLSQGPETPFIFRSFGRWTRWSIRCRTQWRRDLTGAHRFKYARCVGSTRGAAPLAVVVENANKTKRNEQSCPFLPGFCQKVLKLRACHVDALERARAVSSPRLQP